MGRAMSRIVPAVAIAWCLAAPGFAQTVDELVAKNVDARGGAEAWRGVSSLTLTGRMEVGQGVYVPYVLEQKRPNKMRLEFVFDGETAVQCSDGDRGWKLEPFLGRTAPRPMSDKEAREAADTADPYGLLFDYAARGHTVELVGREAVLGRDAFKLKVTLPGGTVRWVYLDADSGLELKIEALRTIGGKELVVGTFLDNWRTTDGLLIPHRQQTQAEGEESPHVLTVETVRVNPPLDDSRFALATAAAADGETER